MTQRLDDIAIEELEVMAEEAPEPGGKTAVDTTSAADLTYVTTREVAAGAGWRIVWDMRTFESSLVNGNQLARQLAKRDENGKRIFTTVRPTQQPERGTMLCMLHANHPDREQHKALGFDTCRKSNLRTALDVRTHMQHRHRREWEALQEERRRQIEEEERAVRQAIIGGRSPAGAVSTPTDLVEHPTDARLVVKMVSGSCPQCGEVFVSDNPRKLRSNIKRHKTVRHR